MLNDTVLLWNKGGVDSVLSVDMIIVGTSGTAHGLLLTIWIDNENNHNAINIKR